MGMLRGRRRGGWRQTACVSASDELPVFFSHAQRFGHHAGDRDEDRRAQQQLVVVAAQAELQVALAADPDLGPVIPGSGGVRKLRWGQPGRGKRGGVRVIYYVKRHDGVIWMLTIYAKNQASTIAPEVLLGIKREIDG